MKKVTTEQLAIMVKDALDYLTKRMDEGFRRMDEKMDEKFERVEARFDSLEHVVGGHTNRIERLEDKVLVLENKQCQK